jgi:hypothetical protein
MKEGGSAAKTGAMSEFLVFLSNRYETTPLRAIKGAGTFKMLSVLMTVTEK